MMVWDVDALLDNARAPRDLPRGPRADPDTEISRARRPTFADGFPLDLAPLKPERAEEHGREEREENAERCVRESVPDRTLALKERAERRADPGREKPRERNGRGDQASIRQSCRICSARG